MKEITIRDIKVFVTAPRGINLVVVKVETSEPELFGYGCATFCWRAKAVVTAVEEYLKPMFVGKSVHNIEDIWQSMMGSSYWRNGPVLNNAMSGVDEALWDIKGKLANMPLYSLLGGKSREGVALYRHADGSCWEEVKERIAAFREEGYGHIRCHMGLYGGNLSGRQEMNKPANAPGGAYYDPKAYMRSVVNLMEQVRGEFGWELEIMHDVHERLTPIDTLALAKELEPYRLFFLEDSVRPDQVAYLRYLREQTSVPLAIGELFTNPLEWKTIIANQWIDYIRVHLSDIGGLTPAIKLAHFADAYQVRTAFHGPNDLSPIGMTAQMHLDLVISNFGIQEYMGINEAESEVFPGCPEIRRGYAYVSDVPGIGVGFDEKAAAKYPPNEHVDYGWMFSRLPDGTAVRP